MVRDCKCTEPLAPYYDTNVHYNKTSFLQILRLLDQRMSALSMSNKGYETASDLPLNTMPVNKDDMPDVPLHDSPLKQISRSNFIHITYILMLVLLAVIWFALTISCVIITTKSKSGTNKHDIGQGNDTGSLSKSEPPTDLDDGFFCQFDMRRLGNVQRYVVQCTYSIDSSGLNRNEMYSASEINVVVCAVVCLLLFLHVLYTALISPLANSRYTNQLVRGLGLPGKNILFSDLNMLLMTKER